MKKSPILRLLSFLIFAFTISIIISCKPQEKQKIAVYNVTKSGVTTESAQKLMQALKVKDRLLEKGSYLDSDGRISIMDSELHLSVAIKTLEGQESDEDGKPVTMEAIDMEKLKSVKTLPPQVAQTTFADALKSSDLLPVSGKVRTTNNNLVLMDNQGELLTNTAINTRVIYDILVDGLPVEGPGAKISASFLGDGSISQLKYAHRKISKGEMVKQLPIKEIKEKCKKIYTQSAPAGGYEQLEIKTRLYYFAPPLSTKGVQTLIPYCECSGNAIYKDQNISLMDFSIPAIKNKKYVPEIKVNMSLVGTAVDADVSIEGGKPPYKIQWSSPSIGTSMTASKLNYTLSRRERENSEILSVEVIDANGVFVHVNEMITFDPKSLPAIFEFKNLKSAATYDYGSENAVFNEFGGLDQGFIDKMNTHGITRRFSWRGTAAWEQDFKETEDTKWIDDTDITFYVGHGNVGLFTFEDNSHDDSVLDNDDATEDWGDKDLEWLALYSCQVLGKDDPSAPYDNWSQEFDGLHLLLGFHTNAQVSNQFSGKFASNMLDAKMTVLHAWFDAIDDHQSSDRVGVIMGVFRRGDFIWNYNDHFHGKGSVGPDIRGTNIGGHWYVTGP